MTISCFDTSVVKFQQSLKSSIQLRNKVNSVNTCCSSYVLLLKLCIVAQVVPVFCTHPQEVKITSPDYKDMDKDAAVDDFIKRIHHYQMHYEPLDEVHDKELSFIRIYNQGEKFLVNRVQGGFAVVWCGSQCWWKRSGFVKWSKSPWHAIAEISASASVPLALAPDKVLIALGITRQALE